MTSKPVMEQTTNSTDNGKLKLGILAYLIVGLSVVLVLSVEGLGRMYLQTNAYQLTG